MFGFLNRLPMIVICLPTGKWLGLEPLPTDDPSPRRKRQHKAAAGDLDLAGPVVGLCLWRLGRFEEAQGVFDRMLWLNPSDNQGVRFLVGDVRARRRWQNDYASPA